MSSGFTNVVVSDSAPAHNPLWVALGGLTGGGIDLSSNGLIVTNVRMISGTNRQVLPTLNNMIYCYIFGPLPQKIVIAGYAIHNDCTSAYYPLDVINSIAAHMAAYIYKPILVSIAGYVFKAFLDVVSAEFKDPTTRVLNFQLELTAIPPR